MKQRRKHDDVVLIVWRESLHFNIVYLLNARLSIFESIDV